MHSHTSVLLEESIEALGIQAEGVYIDGTFGRGGHSSVILQHLGPKGRLIAFDKDADAVECATECWGMDPRFSIYQESFAKLEERIMQLGVLGSVNGILLDLGVSSPQLDNPQRGFSFMQQGPLDMRMDVHQTLDAARFVNQASKEDLAFVFKEYGEERFAGRIARAIVEAREVKPIETTAVLAEIVKKANPKWEKHKHPATRVFQAIRIHVNQELSDLKACLVQALSVLAVGGRLAVISFHSLEDRIVKQFMREQSLGVRPPPGVPIRASEIKTYFKRVGKAIKPQESEIDRNVRARSAVLRVGEKTA